MCIVSFSEMGSTICGVVVLVTITIKLCSAFTRRAVNASTYATTTTLAYRSNIIISDGHSSIQEHVYSLETFCQRLEIPPSNCSCPSAPVVCDVLQMKEKGKLMNDTAVFRRAHGLTVTYATIAVLSSSIGVVGNGVVITQAYRYRRTISPCKLHIAELAVVNLIFSSFQLVQVTPLYWSNVWIYGSFLCKLTKTVLEMGSLLSSGFFQLITVERYLLIVQTFRMQTFQHQYKHLSVAFIFLVVTITIAPYIHGVQIEAESGRCVTFIGGSKRMSSPYAWFSLIIYSLLPIVVTSGLSVDLRRHFSKEKESLLKVRRGEMNKRVMINMLLVLSLFILCTLPSRIVTVTMDIIDYQSHHLILGFQFLSYVVYTLQGTLNPILYSMLAKQWRRNLAAEMRSVFRNGTLSIRLSNES